MILTDGANYKGTVYTNEKLDKDRIMIFLRPYAYKEKPKEKKVAKI